MPIQVTCPGCHTRFNVGDQHAGKTGACPKCKGPIEIPKLEDQVIIHAPEHEAGSRDAKGRNVLKPIRRKETKLNTTVTVGVVGVSLLCVGIAWLIGQSDIEDAHMFWVLAIGAVLLGPPLAYAGYFFLRDDELGVYTGVDAAVRSAACGVVYALMWGVYVYVGRQLFGDTAYQAGLEMLQLTGLSVLIMALGTFTAYVSFDLESFSAFFHYSLYFVLSVLLRAVMGLPFLPGMAT